MWPKTPRSRSSDELTLRSSSAERTIACCMNAQVGFDSVFFKTAQRLC